MLSLNFQIRALDLRNLVFILHQLENGHDGMKPSRLMYDG